MQGFVKIIYANLFFLQGFFYKNPENVDSFTSKWTNEDPSDMVVIFFWKSM